MGSSSDRASAQPTGRARPHRLAGLLAGAIIVAALVGPACSSTGTQGASGPGAGTGQPAPGASTPGSTSHKAGPAKVSMPTVSGPITGGKYGKPFNTVPKVLADRYGYNETEYFLEGTATSYAQQGTWAEDGKWTAKESGTTAPYTTRIIVRLPADKARFNNTVLVEWLNVSAGMDSDPDFAFAHDELMRQGYGYVGVSAQKAGIVPGSGLALPIPGFEAKPLKGWDPERYAKLDHPGDEYSYDIFSQAGATVLEPKGIKPFEGYDVKQVLAAGESQSAFRMTTYVNAVHPLVQLYDGFLIHSRGPGGAAVNADNSPPVPKLTSIRADAGVPVFQLVTETDLFGLGFYPARQADSGTLRTWEVAGTSHADQYTLDAGVESGHEWDPAANVDFSALCGRINDGPQTYVVRALMSAFRSWVVDGKPPPKADPILVEDGRIARDGDGNAKGGIRTAAVDAPTSHLSGEQAESTSVICSLFGFTVPFTPARLAELYPSHGEYVAKVKAATQKAVDAGFVLEADMPTIVDKANEAPVPG